MFFWRRLELFLVIRNKPDFHLIRQTTFFKNIVSVVLFLEFLKQDLVHGKNLEEFYQKYVLNINNEISQNPIEKLLVLINLIMSLAKILLKNIDFC